MQKFGTQIYICVHISETFSHLFFPCANTNILLHICMKVQFGSHLTNVETSTYLFSLLFGLESAKSTISYTFIFYLWIQNYFLFSLFFILETALLIFNPQNLKTMQCFLYFTIILRFVLIWHKNTRKTQILWSWLDKVGTILKHITSFACFSLKWNIEQVHFTVVFFFLKLK